MINVHGGLQALLLFTVLLIGSFIANVLQLACYMLPSRHLRLVACQRVANSWWTVFEFIFEVWSGVRIVLTGDALGRGENAIMIGNHAGGLDFMTPCCLAARAELGCGRMVGLMKKSLQFLPGPGLMNFFTGTLFMSRSWEADEVHLKRKLLAMLAPEYPKPFLFGLFPEGTRITDEKREASWSFSRENNLPLLQHVLLPRTKGFACIADTLRAQIECVYDMTIAYEGGPAFVQHALLEGAFRTRVVHVHVHRVPVEALPRGEEALRVWLLEQFVMKDRLLQHFKLHNCFPGARTCRPPATQLIFPTVITSVCNAQRLINVYFAWTMAFLCALSAFAPKYVWMPCWILAFSTVLRSFTNASNLLQAAKFDRDHYSPPETVLPADGGGNGGVSSCVAAASDGTTMPFAAPQSASAAQAADVQKRSKKR